MVSAIGSTSEMRKTNLVPGYDMSTMFNLNVCPSITWTPGLGQLASDGMDPVCVPARTKYKLKVGRGK